MGAPEKKEKPILSTLFISSLLYEFYYGLHRVICCFDISSKGNLFQPSQTFKIQSPLEKLFHLQINHYYQNVLSTYAL